MRTVFICLLLLLACFAQAADTKSRTAIDPDEAYKNNCMRCHTTVQRYSPRMTKTIMMHMRVRANLPEDVAQAVLAYLNDVPLKSADKPARNGSRPNAQSTGGSR